MLILVDGKDIHREVDVIAPDPLSHLDHRKARHAVDVVLLLEVRSNGDLGSLVLLETLTAIIGVRDPHLRCILVNDLLNGELGFGVIGCHPHALQRSKVLLET